MQLGSIPDFNSTEKNSISEANKSHCGSTEAQVTFELVENRYADWTF